MEALERGGVPGRLATIAVAAMLAFGVVAISAPAAAPAKAGKIRACVDKGGKDKGAMRYVRKGKCKPGERKLTWNKRGKRGKPGAAGFGTGGPSDPLATIQQQSAQIAALQGQVAALCGQLAAVTGQSNALLTVLGAIPGIGTLPSPLSPFACPG